MNKRALLSIIIGTIILFLWNAVSWMALPFHANTLKNIPDTVMQPSIMKKEMPESGVYHFPGMPTDQTPAAMSEIEQKLQEGPRITLMVYKNSPTQLFDPKTFLFSLLVNFLTVIFTYLIIAQIGIQGNGKIFLSALMIGVIAALVSDISQMVWYMFPVDYTLVNALDKIIAFGLLGLLFGLYTFKKPLLK